MHFSLIALAIGLVIAGPASSLCMSTVPDGCDVAVRSPSAIRLTGPSSSIAFDASAVVLTRSPSALARFESARSAARATDASLALRTRHRMGSALRRGGVEAREPFSESLGVAAADRSLISDRIIGFSSFVTGGFDRSLRSDSKLGMGGIEASSQGIVAGFDYVSKDDGSWLVGVAAGVDAGRARFRNTRHGADSRTVTGAFYGSLRPWVESLPGLQIDASLSFGWSDLDELRQVGDGSIVVSDDVGSQSLSLHLLTEYGVAFGSMTLRPQLGLEFFRNHVGAASLGQGLRSRANNGTTLYGSAGIRADVELLIAGARLRPSLRGRYMASVQERYGDLVLASGRFVGHVDEIRKTGDYAVVGGGLAVELWQKFDANVSFDRIVGSKQLRATTLMAGLNYAF